MKRAVLDSHVGELNASIGAPTAVFYMGDHRFQFRPVIRPIVTAYVQRRKG